MTLPSDGEEMRIVPREKPAPRLLADALSKSAAIPLAAEKASPPEPERPTRLFALLGGTIVTAAVIVGVLLHYRSSWLPTTSAAPRHRPTAEPSAPAAVDVSQLHVSAIALGGTRLAVVNGVRVAEGDNFEVSAGSGRVPLRVEKIEDGLVRFSFAGQIIESRLTPESIRKK
jgi:hypothetical protein